MPGAANGLGAAAGEQKAQRDSRRNKRVFSRISAGLAPFLTGSTNARGTGVKTP